MICKINAYQHHEKLLVTEISYNQPVSRLWLFKNNTPTLK
jgi:hypothetical protein